MKLSEVLNQMDMPMPPPWWSDRDSLAFLYISGLDAKLAAEKIADHWLWLAELEEFQLSERSSKMLVA